MRMKVNLEGQDTFSRAKGVSRRFIIEVPELAIELLGWKVGDGLHVDLPITGSGLVVYKDSDPIKLMGGVKEVING